MRQGNSVSRSARSAAAAADGPAARRAKGARGAPARARREERAGARASSGRPGANPSLGALPRPDSAVARWIERTLRDDPPRAPSLIVTIWGDALAPHGGEVWLAGLIRLLAAFGINERLTRTSVFRLARDGWLVAETHGRQSRYRLTEDGRRRFAAAYRRIYAPPLTDWDGEWDLVVDPPGGTDRPRLRNELRWEGFGVAAPGVYVRPRTADDAPALVARLDEQRRALVLRARDGSHDGPHVAERVTDLWDLRTLATDYRRFLALFGRVIDRFRMRPIEASDPAQCFVVRTLLIHAFRRVLLRDPRLPPALLPLDWPGVAAYALTRDFYRLTAGRAEAYLAATLAVNGTSWPPADASFDDRFGGLSRHDR
jgi:phenylacetic acid degradation operon negative regulatory protein